MDKTLLIKAITEYRELGKRLMAQLGNKYDFDISIEEDFIALTSSDISRFPKLRALSEEWHFVFHGMECGFRNQITHQNMEVRLVHPPDFGVIEPSFLLSFLKTSKTYKSLAENQDWQSLEQILNELYQNGEIEEIKG